MDCRVRIQGLWSRVSGFGWEVQRFRVHAGEARMRLARQACLTGRGDTEASWLGSWTHRQGYLSPRLDMQAGQAYRLHA